MPQFIEFNYDSIVNWEPVWNNFFRKTLDSHFLHLYISIPPFSPYYITFDYFRNTRIYFYGPIISAFYCSVFLLCEPVLSFYS